ncbi:Vancomycin resistance protein YoaR, contains peptidoglycan-binding and VanW domains [Pedococcus dokdonensis]|uniref:Vancomycin resistance protein YoaR, contains peptidoglycan-binding and VanW domains n=1 Tax=Pedococcus dokdonensis TaxID=443156 RepID=A0A1H0KRP7_9MICO|nr:VanW family protein [Pedococcus dokdonensis]SDO58545.1 Vancomycin resistance protein YoaR, contains peptidoglycan-binding and VanW domains [Pedococcus dokdonensis]
MKDSGSAALRLGIAVAVLLAGYLGLAWFLGRHIPSNSTVAGVPVGGMSPQRAEDTLRRALASRETAKVTLQAGDKTFQLDPRAAGLSIDYAGTVDGLSGFSLNPGDVWDNLSGGSDEELETTVDRDKLVSALKGAGATLDTAVVQGSVTFPGGKVKAVKPVEGSTMSVDGTADEVAARWPSTTPIAPRVDKVPPAVTAQEVDRAVAEFATPAVSSPVTVKVGAKSFAVQPASFAPALSMKADGSGKLAPSVDNAKLVAAVRKSASAAGLEEKPRDAKITFKGNKPVVVPSAAGATLDEKSVVATFVPALTSPDRTATVTTAVVQPKLTTAAAEKIKPREVVSTFTTYFPYNPPRTENITIAARTLNGTYVGPGEQFSLNKVLGQRTAAKGYNPAPVINNGRLTTDYGGGISQLSTTTFNAAFFSGVKIDEYLAHSFYISRYPEGREATISWPDVDQKWTNDTGYGILIQSFVSNGSVTVTFHGTKVWDIEAVKGPRRNIVQPRTIVDDKPGCVTQTPSTGFDVTVSRIFKKAGKTVRTSTFSTHYIPEDKVTCTHPDAN